MKRIILIIIALSSFSFCKAQQQTQNVWTQEYEKAAYNEIYEALSPLARDEKSKAALTDCFIQKIKQLLPGGLESVSPDSLKKLSYGIGRDCYKEIKDLHVLVKWTPENEQSFRKGFLSNLPATMEEGVRNKLCDCAISVLKANRPDGFTTPVEPALQDSIVKICVKQYLNTKKPKQDTVSKPGAN